jgi:hypothetical protein
MKKMTNEEMSKKLYEIKKEDNKLYIHKKSKTISLGWPKAIFFYNDLRDFLKSIDIPLIFYVRVLDEMIRSKTNSINFPEDILKAVRNDYKNPGIEKKETLAFGHKIMNTSYIYEILDADIALIEKYFGKVEK